MDLSCRKEINLNHTSEMKRELKTSDLVMFGIGAIIGTGISVVTGVTTNQNAGPAPSFSFALAAIVAILSGLSFAEFASRVPVIGGSYVYLYIVPGKFAVWLIGQLLIGELLPTVSSAASGRPDCVQGFSKSLGAEFPQALTGRYNSEDDIYIGLIAVLVVMFVTYIASLEAKKALRLNSVIVYVEFGIIALPIIVGVFLAEPDDWQPFMPFGFSGVLDGAAFVLPALLGSDAVVMTAEKVRNPRKDIPRGIISSILIATVLYITATLTLTGIISYTELGVNDPTAFAMRCVGHRTMGAAIVVGIVSMLLTVMISIVYLLARLLSVASKDGLFLKLTTETDQKHRTPKKATYAVDVTIVLFAEFFPLNVPTELTNIMALAYLMFVSLGLLKLRRMFGKPKAGGFKVPLAPLLSIVSTLTCIVLMLRLQIVTWIVLDIRPLYASPSPRDS